MCHFWPAFLYLKYDQNSGGCVPFWPTPNFIKYHSVINGQIFFAVPALIMGVLYTLLIYQLWFKRKTSTTSVAQRAVLKHRCRFAKMVITVNLIYCICWFPNCFFLCVRGLLNQAVVRCYSQSIGSDGFSKLRRQSGDLQLAESSISSAPGSAH